MASGPVLRARGKRPTASQRRRVPVAQPTFKKQTAKLCYFGSFLLTRVLRAAGHRPSVPPLPQSWTSGPGSGRDRVPGAGLTSPRHRVPHPAPHTKMLTTYGLVSATASLVSRLTPPRKHPQPSSPTRVAGWAVPGPQAEDRIRQLASSGWKESRRLGGGRGRFLSHG